ncbi:MAG: AAA family ATPase, partial [Oscillospiraceae bacterium]|nr:AAA family ATPase [Oscillospiraceae bacterium]
NDMMLNVVRGESVTSGIIHNEENGVDYVPSNINLSSADFYLSQALARESVLKRVLSSVIFSEYDYILIDCLPSLGVLLMNALTASGDVIIPVQTQKFALNGLQGLTDVINQIKNTVNPELRIMGILPTMLDNTVMSRETLNALTNDYQSVFNTKISKSIEAAYSSQKCRSLCKDKSSKLGEEYMLLAEEVEKV